MALTRVPQPFPNRITTCMLTKSPANCDASRAYTNITQILQSYGKTDLLNYMQQYWVSNSGSAETFWEHEFGKHGTNRSCQTHLSNHPLTSHHRHVHLDPRPILLHAIRAHRGSPGLLPKDRRHLQDPPLLRLARQRRHHALLLQDLHHRANPIRPRRQPQRQKSLPRLPQRRPQRNLVLLQRARLRARRNFPTLGSDRK
jgi:hypothetical protein